MNKFNFSHSMRPFTGVAFVLLMLGICMPAQAVVPVVKTVPWVATNPLIPHTTWSGKQITLKGTSDVQGTNFQYSWDFGDGSPPAIGTVSNGYSVEALHAYSCSVGDIFTARLTVTDTGTGDAASQTYFVQCEAQELSSEVNVAIDEGLWYLHKTMTRPGDQGYWTSGFAASSYPANDAANINAFFVNGHLETSATANPYTETVQRGMKYLFTRLNAFGIGAKTYPAPIGLVNPDSGGNGGLPNGLAVQVNHTDPPYQGGSVMDAIIASGTPAAVTTTGAANIIGRSYGDIVQDMVDAYVWGQGYAGTYYGGWRYQWNYGCSNCQSDNSTNQWAAIGMLAAERQFGATVPQFVKDANINSINRTQHPQGSFGYTSSISPVWGYYAVTPSGMVQMALDGIGRGDNRWDRAESFMRSNFCNSGGAGNAVRDYYYGMFSLTKSMLLHDSNGDTVAEPITNLGGTLDWYAAEASKGDPCDGVARTLINDQSAAGYWRGHNYTSTQYPFETGWAIIMLNRTVFASGLPVAVAQAVPNPAVAGQTIVLDGSASFHQDSGKNIISWEWDLDNDGIFDTSGPTATTSYPAVGFFNVTLRVCDDGVPQECDDTTIVVNVDTPPIAPTADANGPYVFCPASVPWFLDGTGSVNPDEGQSEPGQPGDTIQSYAWDLNGDGLYGDVTGAQPDVTAFFSGLGTGDYLVQLRVTDTTATSFPSSGFGDLTDTDSAQVNVKDALDAACACIDDLTALAKATSRASKVQLTWTDSGADHYNIYRSTTAGGPYALIGTTTSTYSVYIDYTVATGTTYHYVVRPAALNGDELCQSNEVSATPEVVVIRRR